MRIKMTKIINRRGIKFFLFLAITGLVSNCSKDKEQAAQPAAAQTGEKSANSQEAAVDSKSSDEDKKQIARLFGHDVGKRLSSLLDPEDIDVSTFVDSFKSAFSGEAKDLPDEEVEKISMLVRTRMEVKQKKVAQENMENGKAYLEENKKQEGIKVTKSGIQYRVLKEGKGEKPKKEDEVSVHYEGKLITGMVFDSSYKRGEPVDFPLTRVIPGWTEILQLMPTGSTWEVTIPSELAYGSQARPTIPANSVLIFKIELISIKKEEKKVSEKKVEPKTEAKKEVGKAEPKVEAKKEVAKAELKTEAKNEVAKAEPKAEAKPKRNIKAKLTVEEPS